MTYSLVSSWSTRLPGGHHHHQHRHDDDQRLDVAVRLRGDDHPDLERDGRQSHRQPLRDPERRLQQHDRPGAERDVRLPRQSGRCAGRADRITSSMERRATPAATPDAPRCLGQGRHSPTSVIGEAASPATSRSPTPAPSAINGWTLAFDFVGAISSIWNASIVSHVGNHYVIQDAGYNALIAAGPERDDRLQRLAGSTRLRADELRAQRRCPRLSELP